MAIREILRMFEAESLFSDETQSALTSLAEIWESDNAEMFDAAYEASSHETKAAWRELETVLYAEEG